MLLAACDRQSGEQAQPQATATLAAEENPLQGVIDRSHRGSELPDFTLKDTAGKMLRLRSLTGKPLLINLWATWCAPCVAELPTLNTLAAGGLKVLAVNQDMGQPEKIAPFLRERGVTQLEPWLDPENDLAVHYDAQTLPATIFYDAGGREVWRLTGGHDWGSAATKAMLAEAK